MLEEEEKNKTKQRFRKWQLVQTQVNFEKVMPGQFIFSLRQWENKNIHACKLVMVW